MPVPNIYESTAVSHWASGAGTRAWGTHNSSFAAVLVVTTAGDFTLGTPTGTSQTWELIANVVVGTGAGSVRIGAWWARATSGSMGDVTIPDTGGHGSCRMFMLQNVVASGNPINMSSTQTVSSATATISMASTSTTVANCLLFMFAGCGYDQATDPGGSGWTNTGIDAAPGFAGHYCTDNGTGGGYMGANGEKAVAGTTGTFAHTWASGATKQANIIFAISDTATLPPAVLTAESGSYVLTGATADLRRASSLTAVSVTSFDATATSRGWFGEQNSVAWFDADVEPVPSASGTYTLVADGASFANTGTDAGLRATRIVAADVAAFTDTGTDATLRIARRVAADAGTFAESGTDATLRATRLLASDAGAFTQSGTAANLIRGYVVAADVGALAVAGSSAALLVARSVVADSGAFAQTGTAAGLLVGRVAAADAGAFAQTGTAAGLLYGRAVAADAGALALTGVAAGVLYGRRLGADGGTASLTGAEATLVHGTVGSYTLAADSSAFALTGTAAGLRISRVVIADAGTFASTGTDAGLRTARRVTADAGSFVETGTAAGMLRGYPMTAASGEFALTGAPAGLLRNAVIGAAGGTYTVTGSDASLGVTGGVPAEELVISNIWLGTLAMPAESRNTSYPVSLPDVLGCGLDVSRIHCEGVTAVYPAWMPDMLRCGRDVSRIDCEVVNPYPASH